MYSIAYVVGEGCPICRAYHDAVIVPLLQDYPGSVTVCRRWGRLMRRIDEREPIRRVPLVVLYSDEGEVARTDEMPPIEELEDALEGDVPESWRQISRASETPQRQKTKR